MKGFILIDLPPVHRHHFLGIKAGKRMAYADCFAVALARIKKAELYTGDREFRAVEEDVKIMWL